MLHWRGDALGSYLLCQAEQDGEGAQPARGMLRSPRKMPPASMAGLKAQTQFAAADNSAQELLLVFKVPKTRQLLGVSQDERFPTDF